MNIKNLNKTHIFRSKLTFFLQIFFLAGMAFFVQLTGTTANSCASGNNFRITKVVIDPGHGGKDPGAVGSFSYEKDIVLAIALKLGEYIETNFNDVQVIYTRKTDVFVPLDQRAAIANKHKADLFISLHINANISKRVFGTETYVMGLHATGRNFEVAKRENSVIVYENDYSTKYEGFDPQSPESYIVFSLMLNTYLDQSLVFASKVQEQFTKEAKRFDLGVKQAGFLVLCNTTMPSVLIEAGFISNNEEEKYLNSEQGQTEIAQAIFNAFAGYKNSVESKSEFMASDVYAEKTKNNQNTEYQTTNKPYQKKEKERPKNNDVTAQNTMETKEKTTENSSRTSETRNDIRFEVQICSSQTKIPPGSSVFKGLENVKEYRLNGMYKYSVGSEASYYKINRIKQQVKRKIPGAFVIAFQNDKKIPVKTALKLSQ